MSRLIKCPYCFLENRNDAAFCEDCSTELAAVQTNETGSTDNRTGPPPPPEDSPEPPTPPEPSTIEVKHVRNHETVTPPVPPVIQNRPVAKSGGLLKVFAIIAASLFAFLLIGVGAFALLNRDTATEIATLPEESPEDAIDTEFIDPFSFDQDHAGPDNALPEPGDEHLTDTDQQEGPLPDTEPEETPPADPPTVNSGTENGADTFFRQDDPTDNSGSGGSAGSSLPGPIVEISIEPNNPTVNSSILFSGADSVSSNPQGTIRSYRWTFCDGVTGTGRAIRREYKDRGLYTVELEVTDDQGKVGREIKFVTVREERSGLMPNDRQTPGAGETGPPSGNWWELD